MNLVSLKLSDEEKKEMSEPTALANLPEYGWGTRIELNDEQIANLGMPALPKVGEFMMIQARVKVMSVSQYDRADQDSERSISLQITDMAVGPDEKPAPEAKDVLYKGK